MARRTPALYTVTTLGAPAGGDRRPDRRRGGLGSAVAVGVGLLLAYLVVSAVLHIVAAVLLWLPAVVLAGWVAVQLRRTRLSGGWRLGIGVVVLVVAHEALLALLRAVGL